MSAGISCIMLCKHRCRANCVKSRGLWCAINIFHHFRKPFIWKLKHGAYIERIYLIYTDTATNMDRNSELITFSFFYLDDDWLA